MVKVFRQEPGASMGCYLKQCSACPRLWTSTFQVSMQKVPGSRLEKASGTACKEYQKGVANPLAMKVFNMNQDVKPLTNKQ